MKRLSIIVFALLTLSSTVSFASKEPKLDAQTQQQVIDRVKEYCNLMQEFSSDVEKIENMDKIFDMCENSNVSVFNDLAAASTKDISDNSMPLQQYMMMVTDKFENNVKTTYSGYKYVKMVVQPSPLKEFDAACYAFVKVDKQVNAPGVKSKQHLNIIVNTSTMKVSSTISEDYEDPQRVYLEALEKFNAGDYKKAIPLFEKVSTLQRFSGRFRAKTMLGWIYAEQKDFQKANDLLRESSDEDPLGGVILASKILLADDAPVNLINYTEAGQILQKVSNVKDKDIPTMHLIAKSAIVDAANIQTLTFKIDAMSRQMGEELITDPVSTDAFKLRGYFVRAFYDAFSKDKNVLKRALEDIAKAEDLLKVVNFDKKDFERWDTQISIYHAIILMNMGDTEGFTTIINTMKTEKPYAAGYLAATYITQKDYQGALELYQKSADYGDAFASYVISLSYLPIHTPQQEYEMDFINETKKVKDEKLIQNWKYFAQYLFTEKSQSNKSYEEFLKWNKKAMDLGDINAMEDFAYYEAAGVLPNTKRDIPHAIELACKAACIGLRSKSFKLPKTHYLALVHEIVDLKIPYEETQTVKTLKKLDEQGNGAASFRLCSDHLGLDVAKDTVLAIKYLERSADANFFEGMHTYALMLLSNDYYEEAEKLYKKMMVYPNSFVHGQLGDIEKDYRHNYAQARQWYRAGIDADKNPECYEKLADLYKDGLGVKKNYKLAKLYYTQAINHYKEFDVGEDDDAIKQVRKKIKEVDHLLVGQANSGTAKEMIAQINSVLDTSISEDQRIDLSQSVLSEVFASPQAVIKTVSSDKKTVVATETAEDFMLRLSTLKTDKRVSCVVYKKTNDEKFKFTELTIQMK